MKYQDLFIFPEGHPPSPYEYPVSIMRQETGYEFDPSKIRFGKGYLPKGLHLCAIGWIEDFDFATGSVPEIFTGIIASTISSKIFSDGTRGFHTCCLCGVLMPKVIWNAMEISIAGYGHYLIQMGKIVYMAPALLLHYIIDHNYCPPQEFVEAVINGQFLTEDDLEIVWRDQQQSEPGNISRL